jgi:hypothetical protein
MGSSKTECNRQTRSLLARAEFRAHVPWFEGCRQRLWYALAPRLRLNCKTRGSLDSIDNGFVVLASG